MLIVVAVAQDAHAGVIGNSIIRGVKQEKDPIIRGHTVRTVRLSLGTPPDMVAALIRKQLGPSEKMDVLKLCSHGNSGLVGLAGRDDENNALEFKTAKTFAPLVDCFHPYRRMIHIHGCAVASETRVVPPATLGTFTGNPDGFGVRFMTELAKWTRCTVQANIDARLLGAYFFGDTVLAYPTGGFCRLTGSGMAQLQ
jgi:hypothetical protein